MKHPLKEPDLVKELSQYVGSIARERFDDEVGDTTANATVFTRSGLARLSPRFVTDAMELRVGTHEYLAARVDEVHVTATRNAFFSLGYLILSVALGASTDTLEVRLSGTSEQVSRILIRPPSESETESPGYLRTTYSGIVTRVVAVVYRPRLLRYVPVAVESGHRDDLPVLRLSDATDENFAGQELSARDTLWISGSDRGLCVLAEAFLNIGQTWQKLAEYSLESSFGYGGVGKDSAELRLTLKDT